MAKENQPGPDIQALTEAVRHLETQVRALQHGASVPQGGANSGVLHLTGVIPAEALKNLEGLPDRLRHELDNNTWGYKYTGQTYGPLPAFGLWVPSGHVDSTPQCGYMNLFGQQRFVKLYDCYWLCAETFVQYWFNNWAPCA